MYPNPPAKPTLKRKESAAAKPGAAKRPVGKAKAPALAKIAEDAASPAMRTVGKLSAQPAAAAPDIDYSTLRLAAPGLHAASAEAAATTEAAVSKPAARQRTKSADLDADAVHAKVVQKHTEGKLTDLTVPEAKCWLKSRKLPLKGKKEELVARILESFPQP